MPAVTLPKFQAPAFNAARVAVGSTVVSVFLDNTSWAPQRNIPFRFGQVFKAGDISPQDSLVGRIGGRVDVPLQFNPLATWPDGSVRHAAISGVLPALAAGESIKLDLVRANKGAISSPAPLSASFSARAVLSFGGVRYTADAGQAMAAAKTRAAGPISTEYNVACAPMSATGPHPDIEVRFDVVYFPAAEACKVDVTVEHTKAFSETGDLVYEPTIEIGGRLASTPLAPLTHFPHARWKNTYWLNNPAPVAVRHDRDYWIDSRAVPNYDRRVKVNEATLASYEKALASPAFARMGNGVFTKAMGTTGGRPDIGLLPGYAAAAVLSMDRRAIELVKACGDIAGSWGAHWRDPVTGLPMSSVEWPYATVYSSAADVNPATGKRELMNYPASSSSFGPEESHTPNFAYLPYLLTGDLYYLEEMQFWTCWVVTRQNYAYRQKEKGIIQLNQTRGQAWSLRGIAECAAFTPDGHPLKSHFRYWLDSNIENYDKLYTNNPNANPLGILNSLNDVAYFNLCGVGLYQDDFFTSVVGHIVELGFESAKPLLKWKAQFQIGRMLAQNGWCNQNACFIALKIRDAYGSPDYKTLGECQAATVGVYQDGLGPYTQEIHDAPCGSQQRLDLMNAGRPMPSPPFVRGEIIGYASSTEGYVANYQPGLAAAVDSGLEGGKQAWGVFDSRPVKPDYGNSPQFAIVPRSIGQAAEPVPAPPVPSKPGKIKGPSNKLLAKLKGLQVVVFDPETLHEVKVFGPVTASSTGVLTLSDSSLVAGTIYALKVVDSKGAVLDIMYPITATA